MAQGMEDAKWWMGVKAGIGFTRASVGDQFSVFEKIQSFENVKDKEYDGLFKNPSPIFGAIITYNFKPFLSISVQPNYVSYRINYQSEYDWVDISSNKVFFKNTCQIRLHYIELPLLMRYEYSFGKFQPHVQCGAYYGLLTNGKYNVESKEVIVENQQEIETNTRIDDHFANELFISSNLGLIAGAGISYDINFFRLTLEANYRYGLHTITNRNNRLEQHSMQHTSYEITDDLSLQNLEISLQCTTPLDYLIHTPGMSGKVGKVRKR
jgi:hypothetical protein